MLSPPIYISLFKNAVYRFDRQVFFRVRYRHPAFYYRVLELAVATFLVALDPTFSLKYFYYFSTFHILIIHTMCMGIKR